MSHCITVKIIICKQLHLQKIAKPGKYRKYNDMFRAEGAEANAVIIE